MYIYIYIQLQNCYIPLELLPVEATSMKVYIIYGGI